MSADRFHDNVYKPSTSQRRSHLCDERILQSRTKIMANGTYRDDLLKMFAI